MFQMKKSSFMINDILTYHNGNTQTNNTKEELKIGKFSNVKNNSDNLTSIDTNYLSFNSFLVKNFSLEPSRNCHYS